MMMDSMLLTFLINIAIALVSAAFAAGGAYFAVRMKLQYMEKDIERNEDSITKLSDLCREDMKENRTFLDRVHERISHLEQRYGSRSK